MKDVLNNFEFIFNTKRTISYFNYVEDYDRFSDNCNLITKSNNFLIDKDDNLISFVNFSSVVYSIRPRCLKCQIEINRSGNLDSCVAVKLNTLDGTMLANQDYKALNNHEIKFEPGESFLKISLLISAQMSTQIGNNFFINMKIHEKSLNLVKLGHVNYCMVVVHNDQNENGNFKTELHLDLLILTFKIKTDVEVIEFLETVYQIDIDETNYALLKLIRDNILASNDDEIVVELVSENCNEKFKSICNLSDFFCKF